MSDKPKLGQHWLKDEAALKAMVKAADIKPGDVVLEVGPGQGALTDKLAAAGARVTAIELDEELTWKLEKSFRDSGRIRIIQGDIRQFDLSSLNPGYKVAANIPYYLTAPLINKLLGSNNPPARMALLVQKEVAQRLAAKPGNLSILGIAAQLYGQIELLRTVPAEAFEPPPKVDSAIVAIKRKADVDAVKAQNIINVAKHGFANKRKTLANSLSAGLGLDKASVASRLESVNIKPDIRAQALDLKQWERLYDLFKGEI